VLGVVGVPVRCAARVLAVVAGHDDFCRAQLGRQQQRGRAGVSAGDVVELSAGNDVRRTDRASACRAGFFAILSVPVHVHRPDVIRPRRCAEAGIYHDGKHVARCLRQLNQSEVFVCEARAGRDADGLARTASGKVGAM